MRPFGVIARRGALAAAGVYVAYAIGAVVLHPAMIYPFAQTPFAQSGFQKQDIAGGAQVVEALGVGSSVLYFAGNVGALAYFQGPLAMHQRAGRHIVALEYPGSGGLAGIPSEAVIKAQALQAFDWMAAQSDAPIIVHGYSLGTSVALYVAAHRDVEAVILDAPFARMCEQMSRASKLPACWLPYVQKWDSLALTAGIKTHVMIQHGTDDRVIPMSDGKRLASALEKSGSAVTFYDVQGAGHNSLTLAPDYQLRVDDFIAKVINR